MGKGWCRKMKIGVVSRSFQGMSSKEVARRTAEAGFQSTELCFTFTDANFWVYNGWKDLSELTDQKASEIVESFRSEGIEVASLGAFSSFMEPDETLLEKNIALYERYLQIAAQNGIPAVATETGFIPGKRGIQADTYEKDFSYFTQNLCRVLEKAERYEVDIALEPCVLDVVPSAKRARDLIAQCGSKRLKILLDPANLIAASDEEDMFKYLAPHVSYFHGKDRKVNDAYGRIVGDGDIDWPLFLSLYHKHCEGRPFILEYVNNDNCEMVRERLEAFDKEAARFA
jgi:sugar phosphate isomerase/epimerase